MSRAGRDMSPRDAAADLVRRLHEAGHVAYFVGGCVRDRLLGFEPTEYDIATDAVPEQVRSLFPGARMVGEGVFIGNRCVLLRRGDWCFHRRRGGVETNGGGDGVSSDADA